MRIGYIVLCHNQPNLVSKIVNKLTYGTENIAVIHVDKKKDDRTFKQLLEDNKQAIFLEQRVPVYWGGFNSVVATVNCLKKALEFNCERYVLLQGADYPLHSNEYIDDFFDKNRNVEFLKAYNITKSYRKYNYMKCYGYHIFDNVDRERMCFKTVIARGFSAINKLGIKYRKGYFYDSKHNEKYDIYWGWGHFALTKECVEYIVNKYDNNKDLNKYFKHIFPADETYFQTIIYNSCFKERTRDKGDVNEKKHETVESMLNLTYFEYPNQVRVFSKEDAISEKILNDFLYIRKISMDFKI